MPDRGELRVYRDAGTVAAAVADLFLDLGQTALADRGAFRVALSGGNTPRKAYELLAQEPRSTSISWSDVYVYFGDERCVTPEDELSNYRMACKAFLDAVPIPKHNVHRMRGEIDPGKAANEYASILRADLGEPPRFDLVLLGLGPDGHTASLFPGSNPDDDEASLVRAVYAKSQLMWRITLTPKVINAARTVAFAIEGTEKAEIFHKVYQGPLDPTHYPAQIVHPSSNKLVWIADELAAGMIRKGA
ncbi:MAG: 6-phosphogluconolactonase [Candidatus Eremiobacteraeota bacterium]|nr:6-phosphogluconolactonase [Candidatus Eremiobacteraeota bacterium]